MTRSKNVLIFKSTLLPYPETFIRAQAESFRDYRAYYAGLLSVGELELPEDRKTVVTHNAVCAKFIKAASFLGWNMFSGNAFVRQSHPALVHAHFESGGVMALPVAEALGVPLFFTAHGSDVTVVRSEPKLQFILNRRRITLARKVSRVIAISKFIREKTLALGYPPEKVIVHYIGIDVSKFQPQLEIEREPVVLYVGRLTEQKCGKDLIDAMGLLSKQRPGTRLVMIGDGPLRGELEARAAHQHVSVEFLGKQPPEDVARWMQRAAVFCLPSVNEGLGIVFCEAQAAGMPVVSTRHGGIPEAVIDGETGLLAPVHNPEELAKHLLFFLNNPALAREWGARGRKHIVEHFNLTTQSAILEQLYDEAIREHCARSGQIPSQTHTV